MAEEYVLESVIAQDSRVGCLDEVVEVGHGLLVAQHISQVVGSNRPSVGMRVDGIDIGGSEEESLGILPIGACCFPVCTGLVECGLVACDGCGVGVVIIRA